MARAHNHPKKPVEMRFWKHVSKSDSNSCWNWNAYRDRKGYGRFRVDNARNISCLSHRMAYELTFGAIPNGLFVCHRCDNPSCCNPSHLFLGTNADNVADMVSKGRQARNPGLRGRANGNSKLTERDAVAIRNLYARGGVTTYQLAEQFNCSQRQICAILHREQWTHV